MANSTIVLGMNVPAKLPNARSVHVAGKSVTDSSPMTTKASPRNSASVPIVTASDGSPSRVTSTPLNAPHSAPTTMQIGMISSSGRPLFHSVAMSALESASTEATDRSISAATITSVSGSAISATSEKSSEPVVNESAVRNSHDSPWPTTTVTSSSPTSSASQRPAGAARAARRGSVGAAARRPRRAAWRSQPARRALLLRRAASTRRPTSRSNAIATSSSAPIAACCQNASTLQDDQRRRDRAEQQRAERRAVDAAGAAEDRHAADDRGGDHRQLVARAGRRVDRAEARGEQHAAEPGERAREHERGEHAAVRADAGEPRALGVRADRVQLAPGAEVAQPLADDQHHDERDEHEDRDAEDRVRAEVQERVGQRLGVDLAAVRPQEGEAAVGVQRPERDHERRHLAQGDEDAVEQPAGRAERHAEHEHDRQREARVRGQQVAGHERAEPEHRADREVDVARDDHERLARRRGSRRSTR